MAKNTSTGTGTSIIQELLKNKEGMILQVLELLQGKETKAKIDLNGVAFNIGKSKVTLEGKIEFTLVPLAKR
ncbi:MAG: hypothetical protein KKA90_01720 [Nanoarchaeota archaeon]|nr:hypothetical protein [Nanoarchaeota archaeon]